MNQCDNKITKAKVEAEAFAYELLMPENMFRKHILEAKKVDYTLSETITYLSVMFGVERKRVLRRLEQLNV